MASTRGITLTPATQRRFVVGTTEGFRWRVEATAAVGMPTAVFLYLKVPRVLYDPALGGVEPPVATDWAGQFNCVASPADLEDYPEGEPLPNEAPAFYRLSYVDQVFSSRQEAEYAYQSLLGAVASLVRSLDAMDDLEARPPITLGAPPLPPPP